MQTPETPSEHNEGAWLDLEYLLWRDEYLRAIAEGNVLELRQWPLVDDALTAQYPDVPAATAAEIDASVLRLNAVLAGLWSRDITDNEATWLRNILAAEVHTAQELIARYDQVQALDEAIEERTGLQMVE